MVADWLGERRPLALVVLGSGLGSLTESLEGAVRIACSDLPGVPASTVQGHAGELVAGTLAGREVLLQAGRFHMYEGHDAATSALMVRVAADLGIRTLVLTNAAGGIRRTFVPGTLMLIADHINLQFQSPLVGPVVGSEERFPDMSSPWSPRLRAVAQRVAVARGVRLEVGVYAGLLGPSYETPAEVRMLERLGADAVGMSTVPEVLAARARGMECVGISTITNLASGIGKEPLSHQEVMETAGRVRRDLAALVEGVVVSL